jgi:hypothetical protein
LARGAEKLAGYPPAVPSQGRAASIRILSVRPQATTCKLGFQKRYPTGDAVRDLIRTDHEFSRNGSRKLPLLYSVTTVLVHSALKSIGRKRTGGSIFFTPPELLFRVVSGLLGGSI